MNTFNHVFILSYVKAKQFTFFERTINNLSFDVLFDHKNVCYVAYED